MKPDWSFRDILFWSRRRKADADEPDAWFPDRWAGAGLFSCELLAPEELASWARFLLQRVGGKRVVKDHGEAATLREAFTDLDNLWLLVEHVCSNLTKAQPPDRPQAGVNVPNPSMSMAEFKGHVLRVVAWCQQDFGGLRRVRQKPPLLGPCPAHPPSIFPAVLPGSRVNSASSSTTAAAAMPLNQPVPATVNRRRRRWLVVELEESELWVGDKSVQISSPAAALVELCLKHGKPINLTILAERLRIEVPAVKARAKELSKQLDNAGKRFSSLAREIRRTTNRPNAMQLNRSLSSIVIPRRIAL